MSCAATRDDMAEPVPTSRQTPCPRIALPSLLASVLAWGWGKHHRSWRVDCSAMVLLLQVASKLVVPFVCRAALLCLLVPCLASAALLVTTSAARADAELCLAAHERAQVDRLEGRYLAARER